MVQNPAYRPAAVFLKISILRNNNEWDLDACVCTACVHQFNILLIFAMFIQSIKAWLQRAVHFITYDIWRITEQGVTNRRRLLLRLLKKLILSLRGFVTDRLMLKAASLTFYTVMAIVPVFALIVAIGRGFGFQTAVDNFVSDLFRSQQDLIPFLTQFVNNYLDQAQGGLFIGIGVAVLLWSVLSVFREIEHNFNDIWNVSKQRSFVRQFTTYISVMLLVPVAIALISGISYTINQRLQSTLGVLYSPLHAFLLQLLPYVMYWGLFILIYMLVPNTRVRFRHALLSGIVAGTLFQLFQYLYINGQINLSRYNSVYGSFAAIPLLLFWLQISWVIVLYGARLCFVSQNLGNYSFEYDTDNISRRYMTYTTLLTTKIIIDRFAAGQKPLTAGEISEQYNIPVRLVNDVVQQLTAIHILTNIPDEKSNDQRYQPACDINMITVQMLLERIDTHGSETFKMDPNRCYTSLWPTVQAIYNHSNDIGGKLVKDL